MATRGARRERQVFSSQPSEHVTLTRCSRCGAGIGVVFTDALATKLDVVDLDVAGEARAIAAGRATFAVHGRPGRAWVRWRHWRYLLPLGLPRGTATAVLAEHRCEGRA